MKGKYLKKIVTFIVIVNMMVTSCILTMSISSGNEMNHRVTQQKPKILRELKKLRTKNSSTYLLSDGSRKLEIYGANTQYKKDGKLKEYKSELKMISKEDRSFIKDILEKQKNYKNSKENNYAYINTSGNARHYFPKKLNSDSEIILHNGTNTISFTPILNNMVEKTNSKLLKNGSGKEKKLSAQEKSIKENSITYSCNNIDYKYTSYSTKIKEKIILNKIPSTNKFEFVFNVPELKLEVNEANKTVQIININSNEIVAYIDSPNIKAKQGELKYEEIKYEVEKTKNGKYILKVVVDENFLKSPHTKYPVTIDPTVVWMDSFLPSATVSSFIGQQNMNMKNGEYFEVQNNGRTTAPFAGTEFRCFISTFGSPLSGTMEQFNGSYVESARLKIVEYSDLSKGAGKIEIKSPSSSWNPNTITWSNKPNMDERVWGEFTTKGIKGTGHYIDLTEWAQSIANGEINNNGLILYAKEKGTRAYFYGSSLQNSRYMQLSIVYWPYKYNVNNYYDQAFNVRYSSCGDSKVKISEANEIVNGIFEQNLGIYTVNNTPQMITSLADNCKLQRGLPINLNTIEQICPKEANHTKNCTERYNIYSDFISRFPGNKTKISVLWTGNKLFDSEGNEANRSFKWYNNGISLQEIWDPNLYYTMMTSCLTHEMAHIYGAPDHYHEIINEATQECRGGELCKTCNPETGRDESCIMNEGWISDIATRIKTTIFCNECLLDMEAYLEENYQ